MSGYSNTLKCSLSLSPLEIVEIFQTSGTAHLVTGSSLFHEGEITVASTASPTMVSSRRTLVNPAELDNLRWAIPYCRSVSSSLSILQQQDHTPLVLACTSFKLHKHNYTTSCRN